MIEQIKTLSELYAKYDLSNRLIPKKGDLVYIQAFGGVYEVKHVIGTKIKVERGNGLTATLPVSYYKIVDKK